MVADFVACLLAGTKLRYKPGVIVGGKDLEHDCGIGYFVEPLILLGLFAKSPMLIRLKGDKSFTLSSSCLRCVELAKNWETTAPLGQLIVLLLEVQN